ncbi:MAG: hypothetical protein M0R46_15985 [Candidatus Muirbacterium halophilum]|nr:hypothetical protein [Candidatus Muirbacterium halophilum]MCK9477416.1 hypothetical protein [Candidatus Muirbacterium halophilum]
MWDIDVFRNNEFFSVIEVVDSKEFFDDLFFRLSLCDLNVLIIDCGNRFDPYSIVRKAKYTHVDYRNILKKLNITRMFTVHQLLNTIENLDESEFDFVFVYYMDILLMDNSYNKNEIKNVVNHASDIIQKMKISIGFNMDDKFFVKDLKDKLIGLGEFYG